MVLNTGKSVLASILLFSVGAAVSAQSAKMETTSRINFDEGWRFALGHAGNSDADFKFSAGSFSAFGKAGTNDGPIGLGFSDQAWRTVNLPHDWAVELPFDKNADLMHGYKPIGRSYPQNSVGWYRKSFVVPKTDEGKRLSITFDGIYRDAYVWVNGHLLGRNESGYIGTTMDLTDYLKYGERNVISVRVDASHFEGWFYEGAGIYRHTWLNKTSPVYFVNDGIAIRPTLASKSSISVDAEVKNDSLKDVKRNLTLTLKTADGKVVATASGSAVTIKSGETKTLSTNTPVSAPKTWSPEDPYLYTTEVTIQDEKVTRKVGFRNFEFDKDKGFLLNGKVYRIQGVCNHQDHAGVGAAIPDRLQEWRIVQLQKLGCNFIRTSHNAPTPEMLDAADRLGMMILDETRMFGSTGEAHSQLERLVKRDRNHPSVIFWSIGNEEWGTQNSPESARIAKTMMATINRLDGTRPSTFGANNGGELNGINSVVDVRGFNYNLGGLDAYHKARPYQPVHGSETASTVTTRGEYKDDVVKGYVSAYDTQKIDWGTSAEAWWKITLERPWFAGGFVWTGFDYRGEPTPYAWPNISSHFGILDTCGFYKDVAYYYQTWWTKKPTLHVFPHWNWKGREGEKIDVWVFSNHPEVELLLNGKSLGKQSMPTGGHLSWMVPYEAGSLVAKGYSGGKVVQETVVRTTGEAVKLVLDTEHPVINADGADVAVLGVKALDANGDEVPFANNKVTFSIEGGGKFVGVGNGDPSSHEPDVFLATKESTVLGQWLFKRFLKYPTENPLDLPELKEDAPGWFKVSYDSPQNLSGNTSGFYRTKFTAINAAQFTSLNVGPIDDKGWVYLNGKLLGTTNDWAASHTFDVTGKVLIGQNDITIVAYNQSGSGGFNCNAILTGQEIPAVWERSLFHGLAQVIVQSGKTPGSLKIKASSPGLESGFVEVRTK